MKDAACRLKVGMLRDKKMKLKLGSKIQTNMLLLKLGMIPISLKS
jgi:hypothetical protein